MLKEVLPFTKTVYEKNSRYINYIFAIYIGDLKIFFSSIKDGFPQQSPRPACDCISGPRLIPAVPWGHPAYIMRALPHAGLPISGNQEDAQPHHHGSWASEPHSIARARHMPFGLNVKGGEVSSPTHPHT